MTFHSSTHSAFMMEFTTPPSYGSTTVTVGAIATDGQILCAGGQDAVEHTTKKEDTETGWSAPETMKLHWQQADSKVSGTLSGSLGPRVDRVDVLAQVPAFLKAIIAQAANSKPFIYQYAPDMELSLSTADDEQESVNGKVFMEATFITG